MSECPLNYKGFKELIEADKAAILKEMSNSIERSHILHLLNIMEENYFEIVKSLAVKKIKALKENEKGDKENA